MTVGDAGWAPGWKHAFVGRRCLGAMINRGLELQGASRGKFIWATMGFGAYNSNARRPDLSCVAEEEKNSKPGTKVACALGNRMLRRARICAAARALDAYHLVRSYDCCALPFGHSPYQHAAAAAAAARPPRIATHHHHHRQQPHYPPPRPRFL